MRIEKIEIINYKLYIYCIFHLLISKIQFKIISKIQLILHLKLIIEQLMTMKHLTHFFNIH